MAEHPESQLELRVANLESQLAFQDDTIETLNQLVTAQSEQLQLMSHKMKLLGQRLQQLQERTDDGDTSDPAADVPPHY
ncbi:Protein SlyX [Pseudidiomarina piscicola]|uniref:Protein SlyX homolog n=1 Tax=Pseudidiomarina piscicola TaxID=2614830 RepID=A0A6S6WSJ0_9GAMM|nr:SlyX family protein [Pseudidiomarina piscicola]CAB0151756.1 Protein SlyX [Pseudidiomarina piscicola]VZT41211.1 Protein SlyX [Pseudomonas aeruginosa]